MKLTVLTAIYRDEKYILDAVQSVLGQTYTEYEYLIIDDHCVDRSREIVESIGDPRIRVIRTPENRGHGGALNYGLQFVQTEFVARLDADDVNVDPRRFEKQLAFLEANPGVAVVGAQVGYIDGKGRRLRSAEMARPTTEAGVAWTLIVSCPISHSTAMYRTTIVRDELGGYASGIRFGEDADLWLRAAQRYRITNLPERMVDYRIVPTSLTRTLSKVDRDRQRELLVDRFAETMERSLRMPIPSEWMVTFYDIYFPVAEVDAGTAARWADLLDRIYTRFLEVHPDAESDPAVREWRSHALALAAFGMVRERRMQSLRVLLKAVASHPRAALRLIPKWLIATTAGTGRLARLQRWRWRKASR